MEQGRRGRGRIRRGDGENGEDWKVGSSGREEWWVTSGIIRFNEVKRGWMG